MIVNAKLAGILDMECLEDRTRYTRKIDHYDSFNHILQTAVNSYKIDLWEGQDYRVMVFCEKDALIGIVQDAAFSLDCPCFSCRGYPSITSLWDIKEKLEENKQQNILTIILYLGDHDCTGLVIDQKIQERLEQFGAYVHVKRIGLTYSQIQEYNIPAAEIKKKDKNHKEYKKLYGDQVWELDGLPPDIIYNLVTDNIKSYLDYEKYNARIDQQDRERQELKELISKFI